MFGRKKLKRIISELEIFRTEWMKIAKTGIEEIKTLKDENAKLKEKIKTLKAEEYSIEYCRGIVKGGDDWKDIAIRCIFLNKNLKEEKDNTIKTLEHEVERLTRKRDANGRYVKSVPIKQGFEVGDKVRIKDGISSATHLNISPFFLPSMDKFIGDVHEIDYIYNKGHIGISVYGFHPDWLEHVD